MLIGGSATKLKVWPPAGTVTVTGAEAVPAVSVKVRSTLASSPDVFAIAIIVRTEVEASTNTAPLIRSGGATKAV